MKKLLMFLVLLTVSVGTWAVGTVSTVDGVCTIQLTDRSDLNALTFNETDLAATKVIITCTNPFSSQDNTDILKINQFTSATTIDMAGCYMTYGDINTLNVPSCEYLLLPATTGPTDPWQAIKNNFTNIKGVMRSIYDMNNNNKGVQALVDVKNENDFTTLAPLAAPHTESWNITPTFSVTGPLSATDITGLNRMDQVTTLRLENAVINTNNISGLNIPNLEYLRLPSNFDAIDYMSGLKSSGKNPKLRVALSLSDVEGKTFTANNVTKTAQKLVVESFDYNAFCDSRDLLGIDGSVTGQNGTLKYVTMSGMIGAKDLSEGESTNSNNFYSAPAVWDFTGATFQPITLTTDAVTGNYYAADNPFCEGTASYPQYPYTTNAFYWFQNCSKATVELTLPDDMTELPDLSLIGLASENKANYKLVYGKTDAELAKMYPDLVNSNTGEIGAYVPMKKLVFSDSFTKIGYEAVAGGHVETVEIGNGIKEICGGAFSGCDELSEVIFTPGTSDCRLGDSAFGLCKNMKHIELIEGIISLGHNCFNNSQHVESVRLPESLEEIGNGSFGLCYALSSIVIPPNVRKIGREAFYLAALKSIYLTTTDPANIPVIFSAGTTINPNNFSTFYTGAIDGNITCAPKDSDDPNGGFGDMTWEQAANWYFTNNRTMAALYFPEQLYYKVRGDICEQYKYTSSDGGKLPSQDDIARRYNLAGLSTSEGEYTQDGWAQFLLMQAYDPSDPDSKVLTKEYDDVWYTMCFPFDLTDEQLTEAFNRSFNIVDFSGVEVTTTETTRNIVLHFNNVAETKYKDDFGNVYERVMITDTNGKQVAKRLRDGNYDYNVYTRVENGTTYYYGHIIPANASTNEQLFKTKIFAKYTTYDPNGTTSKTAFSDANRVGTDLYTIDGYLALAGHPYMIHPNVGVVQGVEQGGEVGTKKACRLAGIIYKNVDNPETETVETNYDWLYEQQARTVDLGGIAYYGESKPDGLEYPTSNENFTENNFNQAAYPDYQGQTYTFKGNWREYSSEGDAYVAQNPEPQLTVQEPIESEYMTRGDEPQEPPVVDNPGENPPTQGPNPANDTDTYPTTFQTFYSTIFEGTFQYNGNQYTNIAWGELIATVNDLKAFSNTNNLDWKQPNDPVLYAFFHTNLPTLNNYISTTYEAPSGYQAGWITEEQMSDLQTKCNNFKDALDTYNNYPTLLADYNRRKAAYDKYLIDHAKWETAHSLWENWTEASARQAYQDAYTAYTTAVTNYNTAHNTWLDNMKEYFVWIPYRAYFLGRAAGEYPRYYREVAPVDANRTGGRWSQYAAIVIPNGAALAAVTGVEDKMDLSVEDPDGAVKGVSMAFNEDFVGEFDANEIKDIIADAEKNGQKVEYLNIIYSINGEIVGKGANTLNNLPQGMYIINGKKYLVK